MTEDVRRAREFLRNMFSESELVDYRGNIDWDRVGEGVAAYSAAETERIAKELKKLKDSATTGAIVVLRNQFDEQVTRAEAAEAERDRLRKALEQAILLIQGHQHVGGPCERCDWLRNARLLMQ